MGKRKYESGDKLEAFAEQLKDLYTALFSEGGKDLAGLAILRLSQEASLTISDLQRLKTAKPSFSAARWDTVAPSLSLRADLGIDQLEKFIVPIAVLPPSFHRELMKNASRWLDVYLELPNQVREEARVRLLEAWYVPICSLFNGRLVDKPDSPMPETPETSGGEVEHEVFLFDNVILLVVEMKLALKSNRDHCAQVLLELVSAMELYRDRDLNPQPPVYALLSDLERFYFLSYDGTSFKRLVSISVLWESRRQFMEGMVHVSDLLFSVLLNGYIEILAAVERRSTMRGNEGDISKHNSFSPGKPDIREARKQARDAQNILVNPDFANEQTWEKDCTHGMDALNKSLKHLVKIGSDADWDKDDSVCEISRIMERAIETHRSRQTRETEMLMDPLSAMVPLASNKKQFSRATQQSQTAITVSSRPGP